MAVTALVCGIVGSVFGLVPLFYLLALALGLIAFIFGILGRRKAKADPEAGRKTMATWGIVLGVVAFGLGVFGATTVDKAVNDTSKSLDCLSKADTPKQINACD